MLFSLSLSLSLSACVRARASKYEFVCESVCLPARAFEILIRSSSITSIVLVEKSGYARIKVDFSAQTNFSSHTQDTLAHILDGRDVLHHFLRFESPAELAFLYVSIAAQVCHSSRDVWLMPIGARLQKRTRGRF